MLDQSRDLQLIFHKYQDKASKGNYFAMMYVADCYLYGWGTQRDSNRYKDYLNQAAMQGVQKACERLFYESLAVQNFREVERILSIWEKSEDCSVISKYRNTIEIYNSLTEKNISEMLSAFTKSKFPNDWDPTTAMCYQFGFGVEKNPSKAASIIVNYLGTQYDFADNIANLLGLYDIGEISKDQIGEHLFDEMKKIDVLDTLDSIEHPNAYAGYRERLMAFAACSGHANSQMEMAKLYLGGEFETIHNNEYANDTEALRWLLLSLENCDNKEDVIAPLVLLADSMGEKNDFENAFKAWYAAAENGFIPAQRIVAAHYYDGVGIAKDYMQAGKWWLIAAQNGEEEAVKNVNIITDMGNGDYWTGIKVLMEQNQDNHTGNTNGSSSSYGKNQQSGGCYVATCVYGSYDCPEVWTLRRYRDNKLALSLHGRIFIYMYYKISPYIVQIFGGQKCFKAICKSILDRIIIKLQNSGIESTPYNDALKYTEHQK